MFIVGVENVPLGFPNAAAEQEERGVSSACGSEIQLQRDELSAGDQGIPRSADAGAPEEGFHRQPEEDVDYNDLRQIAHHFRPIQELN